MKLIDTHAHLYHKEFDRDIHEALQRCAASGVSTVLLPAIDSESHEKLLALSRQQVAGVRLLPMMGVHPCSITADYEKELQTARSYLDRGGYCAVGEIGLDYYWDVTYKQQQLIAFEEQINWAIEKNLPIAIHTRNAIDDAIALVGKYKGRVQGVFHCFGGTLQQARQITELGFYLGIGGVFTYKNSDLRHTLAHTGLSHIVLETDAPYLSPVPHRGKRNESAYTAIVAQAIAEALQLPVEHVAEVTTANAVKLFGL